MILSLMSHKEARRGMAYWKEKHQPIFNIIRFGGGAGYRRHHIQCDKSFYPVRETMGLKQFSVEDIDTVLGILLVNDFEINSKVRKSFQK